MPGLSFDKQLSRDVIGTRITRLFFDRPAVEKAVDTGVRKVLSRFGYFVMRDARQSIKRPRRKPLSAFTEEELKEYRFRQRLYRQGRTPFKPQRPLMPSEPGEPPRNQMGLLKQFIFFTYEPSRRSVVIGPARLAGAGEDPPVPEVLEYGGATYNRRVGKRVRIEARPYMRPAFSRQMQKQMPQMWQNAVSR